MELLDRNFGNLSEQDIINILEGERLIPEPTYSFLITMLVIKSHMQKKILEDNIDQPYYFYCQYLGLYLRFVMQEKDNDIIEKLKVIIRDEDFEDSFYEMYISNICIGDNYTEEILSLVHIMKDIKGEEFIIEHTLNWLVNCVHDKVFGEILNKIELKLNPIDVMTVLISCEEFFSICKHENLFLFLLRFYINKEELTFNTILELVNQGNNDILKEWIREVELDDV